MTDVGIYEVRSKYFASKHTNSVSHSFVPLFSPSTSLAETCHIFVSPYGVLKPGEFSFRMYPLLRVHLITPHRVYKAIGIKMLYRNIEVS